uniref:Sphingomyelin synthase-like domain-containing protein n=1 Tax=Megaselia scalaris TaxID=36166 RepID=T1GRA6_MEGSC
MNYEVQKKSIWFLLLLVSYFWIGLGFHTTCWASLRPSVHGWGKYIVMRRIFLIVAVLYFMRSITMYVTVLPVSSTTYFCSPKSNNTTPLELAKRVFQLLSGFGLSINGKHTYCGDYIYSGHTVILVLGYLIIAEYAEVDGRSSRACDDNPPLELNTFHSHLLIGYVHNSLTCTTTCSLGSPKSMPPPRTEVHYISTIR